MRYLGQRDAALSLFEQALNILKELGNRRLESISRSNRAGVLSDPRRFDDALKEAATAKMVAEDAVPLVWALCWEASALGGLGRYQESEASFSEAFGAIPEDQEPSRLGRSARDVRLYARSHSGPP